MRLIFKNNSVEKQCTDLRVATKLFGGNRDMARSLMSRINLLERATVIKDIIKTPFLTFHKLHGNLEGCFAIDVKTHRDPWRIIIRPLDENEEAYVPCNIDEIAGIVEIVEIEKVSKHYE